MADYETRFLTIHDHPHILDEAEDDLKSSGCCSQRVIVRGFVLSLYGRLDIPLF